MMACDEKELKSKRDRNSEEMMMSYSALTRGK